MDAAAVQALVDTAVAAALAGNANNVPKKTSGSASGNFLAGR